VERSPELANIPVSFSTQGDIRIVGTTDNTVTIETTANYGKGRITASIIYKLDPKTLTDTCFLFGCWSTEGIARTTVDVYQKFSPAELAPNDQIFGSDHIVPGDTLPYSVRAILTRNLTSQIGVDIYTWIYPPYMSDVLGVYNGDGSSITLSVANDAIIGTDTIKVVLGRCNASTPLIKLLQKGSELPTVTHDNLDCTDADTVRFKIENPKMGYSYRWIASNHPLTSIVPVTPNNRNHEIMAISDGIGSVITLFASNGHDTVTETYVITKKVTKPIKIRGDVTCVQAGDILPYELYPSPNVEVKWQLPDGWHPDGNNEHSSSIYVTLSDAPQAGFIIASSMVCDQVFDSIFVTVTATYIEEGIISDNGVCFTAGDTATFRFKKDPNAKFYTWNFPVDWLPLGINPSMDMNDTVMQFIVGETIGNITVTATTFCGDGWTMTFDSVFASPSVGSISLTPKSCINDGVLDTIELIAEGANGVTQYQWLYPNTWNVLNATDNTIELSGVIIGDTEVFVIGINEQCKHSDTVKITITPTGADVGDFIITYEVVSREIFPGFSFVYQEFTANIDPLPSLLTTSFGWFTDGNCPVYANAHQSSIMEMICVIDTNQYNYWVVVTNSMGCITRRWLKNPFDGDVEYTDIIVEVTPPNITPALVCLTTKTTTLVEDNRQRELVLALTVMPIPPAPQQQAVEKTIAEIVETNEPTFKFHPNPANGDIHLQFDDGADFVEILDVRGFSVMKQRVTGSTEKKINVSNLRSGMYIVRVIFGEVVVSEKLQIVR